MKKNAVIAMGLAFMLVFSGCGGGILLKRPALKPEAAKGGVLILGKYVEPPYSLEIFKAGEEGDKYAIYLNGTRVVPFTGAETLKECDRMAKNIEGAVTMGCLVYFEKDYQDGYRSISSNNWPAIRAILDSKKTDKDKIDAISGQVVGNSLLAKHIMESNR